ncbi:MAG: hypothetical protein ABFC42_05165, partial [Sulfuricella sp.]
EEAAAAAESLEEQAQNLSTSVSVFKLDTSGMGGRAVATRQVAHAKTAVARPAAKPAARPKPVKTPAAAEGDEWQEF